MTPEERATKLWRRFPDKISGDGTIRDIIAETIRAAEADALKEAAVMAEKKSQDTGAKNISDALIGLSISILVLAAERREHI